MEAVSEVLEDITEIEDEVTTCDSASQGSQEAKTSDLLVKLEHVKKKNEIRGLLHQTYLPR